MYKNTLIRSLAVATALGAFAAPAFSNPLVSTAAGEIIVNSHATSIGGGNSTSGSFSDPSVLLTTPSGNVASGVPSGRSCIYTESVEVGFLARAGHSYGRYDWVCVGERLLSMGITYHELARSNANDVVYNDVARRFVVGSANIVLNVPEVALAMGVQPVTLENVVWEEPWRP